jgi:hypothetical protein
MYFVIDRCERAVLHLNHELYDQQRKRMLLYSRKRALLTES